MVCVLVVVWTSVHLSSFVCQCAFVFVFICGGVCRYAFFSMGNGQAETDEMFADQWDPQQH